VTVEFIYNKWTIRKRYSDFEDLHKSLKITYNHLPALPGKSLFALKKDADIDKRRLGLDVYIKELVKRADVYADPHFAKFLEVRSWIFRGLSIVGRTSTRYDN
jgi:sorting nexin-13